jgi:hypothetical protein
MRNITLLNPIEAQKICNIIPSSLESIYNNGHIKKYWYDARFYYNKDEIECLVGLDSTALLGYGGDIIGERKKLKLKLNTLHNA